MKESGLKAVKVIANFGSAKDKLILSVDNEGIQKLLLTKITENGYETKPLEIADANILDFCTVQNENGYFLYLIADLAEASKKIISGEYKA